MREMPIVFAADDVRATLAGRKTQYRRPLFARNCLVDGVSMSAKRWDAMQWGWGSAWVDHGPSPAGNPGPYLHVLSRAHGTTHRIYPRVQPGDGLWVRERWLPDPPADHDAWHDHTDSYVTWSGCGSRIYGVPPELRSPEHCIYREGWNGFDLVWRPSIHMPRWASRITLEVTGVRVERLQDISEADAMAEGIRLMNGRYTFNDGLHESRTAVESFRALLESINGSGSWDANPWVQVVEFAMVPA